MSPVVKIRSFKYLLSGGQTAHVAMTTPDYVISMEMISNRDHNRNLPRNKQQWVYSDIVIFHDILLRLFFTVDLKKLFHFHCLKYV